MPRRTVVRPAAVAEAEEAKQWYEDRLPSLGETFLDSLEVTVQRIEADPLAYPVALLPGIGGAATRMGYTEVLYVTELIGLSFIWIGYRQIVRGPKVAIVQEVPAAAG